LSVWHGTVLVLTVFKTAVAVEGKISVIFTEDSSTDFYDTTAADSSVSLPSTAGPTTSHLTRLAACCGPSSRSTAARSLGPT
jgi:hypothetical protein